MQRKLFRKVFMIEIVDSFDYVVLDCRGKGNFKYVPQWQSGLNVQGNCRSMQLVNNEIIFGMNNSKIVSYLFH